MHSNQSWPPVISPLGVHPCFRNATRAKQGYCRGWQGHTDFLSNLPPVIFCIDDLHATLKRQTLFFYPYQGTVEVAISSEVKRLCSPIIVHVSRPTYDLV